MSEFPGQDTLYVHGGHVLSSYPLITDFCPNLDWMRTCPTMLALLSYSLMVLSYHWREQISYQSFNIRGRGEGLTTVFATWGLRPGLLQGFNMSFFSRGQKACSFQHQSYIQILFSAWFYSPSPTNHEVWLWGIVASWVLLCPLFSSTRRTRKDMGQGPALKIHSFNSIRAMVHH